MRGISICFRNSLGFAEADEVEPKHIAEIRDNYGSPSAADHYVAVIRAVYSWGIERGFARINPAADVSKISTVKPYEPWEQWAWDLVARMRPEIRIACSLGYYTGQRLGDVLRMHRGHIKGNSLSFIQSKTGKVLTIPCHRDLAPTLNECRDRGAIYLVSKSKGAPFNVDQFHAMWGRMMAQEPFAAIKRAGFSFHGLRKNAVCALLEAGCSAKEVGSITGQSLHMVEHYSHRADQIRLARAAMAKWEGQG